MPILKTPNTDTGTWSDGLWRNTPQDLWNYDFTYPEGQALVKINGVWTVQPIIDLDAATEYYGGGRTHTISEAKAAELTAAGFGAYISPDESTPVPGDPPGFGEGGFGEGGFGE